MTIRGGVQRSIINYSIGGREVTAAQFAAQTQAPLRTSSGQATALGRDVGVDLPRGATVATYVETPSGNLEQTGYYKGTSEDKPREEKKTLTSEFTKGVSSSEAGKILQRYAGYPYSSVSKNVPEVRGGATRIQKITSGFKKDFGTITGNVILEGKELVSEYKSPRQIPFYTRTTRTDLAPQPSYEQLQRGYQLGQQEIARKSGKGFVAE